MARAKCLQVIKLMPKDHSERPTAQRVLGTVYYSQAQPELAKAAHTNALQGYLAQGREYEAAWVEEMLADDEGSSIEQNATDVPAEQYAPIIRKLQSPERYLLPWWRVGGYHQTSHCSLFTVHTERLVLGCIEADFL